jgi:hypothetical protein
VGEEETSCRVMGIGVCVGVFVVLAVITHPYIQRVLGRQAHKISTCMCLFMSTDAARKSSKYIAEYEQVTSIPSYRDNKHC